MVPIRTILSCEPSHCRRQGRLVLAGPGNVSDPAAVSARRPADTPLGMVDPGFWVLHGVPSSDRAQYLSSTTPMRICLSTAKSATARLSRAFSGSSSLSRIASSTCIPPYHLRQRWEVRSARPPNCLTTSVTILPSLRRNLGFALFADDCSGVYRFFAMIQLSYQLKILAMKFGPVFSGQITPSRRNGMKSQSAAVRQGSTVEAQV